MTGNYRMETRYERLMEVHRLIPEFRTSTESKLLPGDVNTSHRKWQDHSRRFEKRTAETGKNKRERHDYMQNKGKVIENTYWDRRAPDGRGVSACLSVGVALKRLPSKFSPPPCCTLPSSRPCHPHSRGGNCDRAQPRFPGSRDWPRRWDRTSAPNHHRANYPHPPLTSSRPPSRFMLRGWHGPGGRGNTPGITTTVDAARYFWRQVDMSFTCTTVGCWLLREKGVRERGEHGTAQCSSTSNHSTLSTFISTLSFFLFLSSSRVPCRYRI